MNIMDSIMAIILVIIMSIIWINRTWMIEVIYTGIKSLLTDNAEKYIGSFGKNLTEEQIDIIKNSSFYQRCSAHDAYNKLLKVIAESIFKNYNKGGRGG